MEKDQERLKVIMIKIRRKENKKSFYYFVCYLRRLEELNCHICVFERE